MRRRTFDALATAAGLLLVVVLVVAGVLLTWGHSYANNQVTSQLSAQKIVFPTTSNPEFKALPKAARIGGGFLDANILNYETRCGLSVVPPSGLKKDRA